MREIFTKIMSWANSHTDKVLHFMVSMVLTLYIGAFSFALGIVIPFVLGVLKEVFDAWQKYKSTEVYHFDSEDLIADVAGIVAAAVPMCILMA